MKRIVSIMMLACLTAVPASAHHSFGLVFDTDKPDGTPRKLLDVTRMKALGWTAKIDLPTGLRSTYEDLRRSLQ